MQDSNKSLVTISDKNPVVRCSSVQFGQKKRFCKLHVAAYLRTELKNSGRFDSLHPLHSVPSGQMLRSIPPSLDAEVTGDRWSLLISDPQYDSQRYDGYGRWKIPQER
jgi:hypothetical protein